MRQGRQVLVRATVLGIIALAALPLAPRIERADAGSETSPSTSEARARTGQRQFTGIVTALDKSTITVEKPGKKPRSRVFSRDAEMTVEGVLAKAARVTVYYRERDGRAIAHRVVVRPANKSSPSDH